MSTVYVVVLAIIAGILAVLLIFLLYFCLRKKDDKQPPSPVEPARRLPTRTESVVGIRPKISSPIYTINTERKERENIIADTLTTRKLSMMFDTKKKFSTAFSHKSVYFDFENSPLPRHKEYLDFTDIENMIPGKKSNLNSDRPSLDFLNEIHEAHANRRAEKSSPNSDGSGSSKSIQKIFYENEMSIEKKPDQSTKPFCDIRRNNNA